MVDTISDMFCAIQNAQAQKKPEVLIPFSKFKFEILKVFQREGFVEKVEKVKRKIKKGKSKPKPFLRVFLKYEEGKGKISKIKRISKPSQRVYVSYKKLKLVKGGFGFSVLSTSKGVFSNKEAKKMKVGGELICEVW